MSGEGAPPTAGPMPEEDFPFPDSLCHECAAPPRYIRTSRSTFIYCPLFKRYPPQPVRACEKFVSKSPPLDTTAPG